jgi:hypothetical protein
MQTKWVAGAVLLLLLTGSVEASRGYFDPKSYEKGGFAPVTDAQYQSACGTCHFAYLPGMLPARSWETLLTKSNEHFGQTLSLDAVTLRHIRDFLTANAADRSDFLGSKEMLQRLSNQSTPLRVTSLPAFKNTHAGVLYKLGLEPGIHTARDISPDAVKAVLNCNTCHKGAAAGSFAERETVTPDIAPNGLPRHGAL